MDRSERAGRASRQFRQGVTRELEPPREPAAVRRTTDSGCRAIAYNATTIPRATSRGT